MAKTSSLLFAVADILFLPLAAPAAWIMKAIRRAGMERLPRTRSLLRRIGVFPIRNHYYEPLFDFKNLRQPLSSDRSLPGIDMNLTGQLELLSRFNYADELSAIPVSTTIKGQYAYDNGWYGAGDAEFLYSIIRLMRPRRIVEVGSGQSTLMAVEALRRNVEEGAPACEHVCIEPYENPWLEQKNITVLRKKLEDVDPGLFRDLQGNDILFIDSSHVIRPQGDVLKEILEILPILNPGVIVHFHDIFTPRDYPESWLEEKVLLWNEQYLLEAFLSCNREFVVIGALDFLARHHFHAMAEKFPIIAKNGPSIAPGAFWLLRRSPTAGTFSA
jgi:hypothetical protein